MKKKVMVGSVIFAMVGAFSASSQALVSSETKQAADHLGAADLAEVKFEQKQAGLSDEAKKDLAKLVTDAKAKGDIKEIKILAWADEEYPTANQPVSKAQTNLASQRDDQIKNYLKKELHVSKVDVYNMAERPGKLAQWLKTSDAKVKDTAEASGAAPRTKEETGFLGLKGQASKAVALVFMK